MANVISYEDQRAMLTDEALVDLLRAEDLQNASRERLLHIIDRLAVLYMQERRRSEDR